MLSLNNTKASHKLGETPPPTYNDTQEHFVRNRIGLLGNSSFGCFYTNMVTVQAECFFSASNPDCQWSGFLTSGLLMISFIKVILMF